MDALGSIKPVVSQPVRQAPVLPNPAQYQPVTPFSGAGGSEANFDAQIVEAKRQDVLVSAARSAPQPLGSQAFTIYKDMTGQFVTRFRDTNSGKVTYIPEPQLLRLANVSNRTESLVNIKA